MVIAPLIVFSNLQNDGKMTKSPLFSLFQT